MAVNGELLPLRALRASWKRLPSSAQALGATPRDKTASPRLERGQMDAAWQRQECWKQCSIPAWVVHCHGPRQAQGVGFEADRGREGGGEGTLQEGQETSLRDMGLGLQLFFRFVLVQDVVRGGRQQAPSTSPKRHSATSRYSGSKQGHRALLIPARVACYPPASPSARAFELSPPCSALDTPQCHAGVRHARDSLGACRRR